MKRRNSVKVETKFDIDQIVYFSDKSEMYAGTIKDISLRDKGCGGDIIYYIFSTNFSEDLKRRESQIFPSEEEVMKHIVERVLKENEMVRRGYIKKILQLGESPEESIAKIVEELFKKINDS